ncbi:MAG: ABC transporter ATP-binding protein [Bacilli bacterium]|nr:ABC transporter ATP-binding protein [Bacilli bacterium]
MKTIKEFLWILNKKQKWQLVLLFFMLILSSGLELFGLSILVPVVDVVAYPQEAVQSNELVKFLVTLFSIPPENTHRILLATILFVIVVYLFKCAYSLLLTAYQTRFVNQFIRQISVQLLSNYLYQPYEFHVYTNSSELYRNATSDASVFVGSISLIISSLSDLLFMIIAMVYLFFVDWRLTLIVFVALGSLTLLFVRLMKKKVRVYSMENWRLNAIGIKNINEGLSGIKETKISNREQYFIDNYDATKERQSTLWVKSAIINAAPRALVEAVGMITMLVALLLYAIYVQNTEAIVTTFATLALVVVKILPYLSRLNGNVNSLRWNMVSIHKVYEDLKLVAETPVINDSEVAESIMPLPFRHDIAIEKVGFHYRNADKYVLRDADATIRKGESVAFCGASGAGKTTTVDIILGLLKPQEGRVLCDGENIANHLREWHKDISYVPQEIFLIDNSIKENIAFGHDANKIPDEIVWKALEQAQLADFVRSLPEGLQTQIGEKGVRLSGGQRQRIGIARALFRDTPIIVFDEATSALDFETEAEVLKTVVGLKGEKTLIIITHRLSTIKGCDRIYEIKDSHMVMTKGPEIEA